MRISPGPFVALTFLHQGRAEIVPGNHVIFVTLDYFAQNRDRFRGVTGLKQLDCFLNFGRSVRRLLGDAEAGAGEKKQSERGKSGGGRFHEREL